MSEKALFYSPLFYEWCLFFLKSDYSFVLWQYSCCSCANKAWWIVNWTHTYTERDRQREKENMC